METGKNFIGSSIQFVNKMQIFTRRAVNASTTTFTFTDPIREAHAVSATIARAGPCKRREKIAYR